MKHIFITALIAFSFGQIWSQSIVSKTALKSITIDVKTLASDKMEGRETGTKGEQRAADYISKRMETIGLKPYGIGGYFQEFTFTPKRNPHSHGDTTSTLAPITGKNVIGYLDNGAENTVVIGAHYDHLGMGAEGSLHAGKPAVHNGADDNASGVAGLLYLAERLKSSSFKNNNYLFIAFSGEEKGLWGSKSYVNNPTVALSKVNYMINMDMIGRLDSNKLAINGVGTSKLWKEYVMAINQDLCAVKTKQTPEPMTCKYNLVLGESGIGPSDHTSFYLKNIPVLQFFTGQHSDYHKPGDDFEKVNLEGIAEIGGFIFKLIGKLDDAGKLDYQKTKGDAGTKAPRFKVTLGVMPDYMFQGEGMRVDGTIPDRPAEKAGIQGGDIVTRIGEVDVQDMQTYMKALGQFSPGDKANVNVVREGKKMTFEVSF